MSDPLLLLQGVANRDIKLENTLLDGSPRPLVKICDFGYSKVCNASSHALYHGILLLGVSCKEDLVCCLANKVRLL